MLERDNAVNTINTRGLAILAIMHSIRPTERSTMVEQQHDKNGNDGETRQALPEGFQWHLPQWIRVDRLKARPLKFAARIILGGFLGLLFGRVLGSLQGLFLQWVYDAVVRAAPGVDGSLGRVIHTVAVAVGTVFSPFLYFSPFAASFADARLSGGGSLSLLFLAQIHGSVNGLFQGIRPLLGDRCQRIVERAILGWGMLWHWMTWPIRVLFFRAPSREQLQSLLLDAGRPDADRKLRALLRRGLLPASAREGGEEHVVMAWPGKTPVEKRQELWWTRPALRTEVYRWIESAGRADGLSLLVRGLSDPDDNARIAAVNALAALGTSEAVPFLVSLLEEPPPIHAAAVTGLKRCAGTDAT